MPCNLNFNQCNLGPSYPTPIYTCGCRLARLLSSSANNVVNPIVIPDEVFLSMMNYQIR